MQAHAVMLDLPANICAQQAAGRVDHEGGLQGPQALRMSNTMSAKLRREGPPSKAEGFKSVIVRPSRSQHSRTYFQCRMHKLYRCLHAHESHVGY